MNLAVIGLWIILESFFKKKYRHFMKNEVESEKFSALARGLKKPPLTKKEFGFTPNRRPQPLLKMTFSEFSHYQMCGDGESRLPTALFKFCRFFLRVIRCRIYKQKSNVICFFLITKCPNVR